MEQFSTNSYRILTDAAIRALKEHGWSVRPAPGLGKANVRIISKDGEEARVSIRTSRDRWFAFQPQNGGANWKTLDSVGYVCVASSNDKDNPSLIHVNFFDADLVRDRFKQAYSARHDAGATPGDDFGMWVALDEGNGLAYIGGGLAADDNHLATYSVDGEEVVEVAEALDEAPSPEPAKVSVSDVLATARHEIAILMGLPITSVNLEVHIKP